MHLEKLEFEIVKNINIEFHQKFRRLFIVCIMKTTVEKRGQRASGKSAVVWERIYLVLWSVGKKLSFHDGLNTDSSKSSFER